MKSYDFEESCSDELKKDFDNGAYIRLSRDFLNRSSYWTDFQKSGDVSFLYEIIHENGTPYLNSIERTGHVLVREGKVIDFMSHNLRPGPISEIVNISARSRAEHIAKNIEDILFREMKDSA